MCVLAVLGDLYMHAQQTVALFGEFAGIRQWPALLSCWHSLSMTEESWMSRMADASTMLRTMKRLIALSLATSTPDASQRTRFTY